MLGEDAKRRRDLSIHMHTHTVTSFPANQITFSMIVVAATAGPLLLLRLLLLPFALFYHTSFFASSYHTLFPSSQLHTLALSGCRVVTTTPSPPFNAMPFLCALHARQTRMPIIMSSEPGNCNQTVREVSECRIDCKVWGCKINNLFIGFK